MKRSDDEPKGNYETKGDYVLVPTRFPFVTQIMFEYLESDKEAPEFTIRRALEWAFWCAFFWLLVAGLYAVATSASSPDWAVAMGFCLISIVVLIALVCSFFAVAYPCGLIIERWRLRKERRA